MIIHLPEIIQDLVRETIKDRRVFDILHDKLLDLGVDSEHWTLVLMRERKTLMGRGTNIEACFLKWKCYNTETKTFAYRNIWETKK